MNNELTFDQRLAALLALLDDAIKRDSERTPGEWIHKSESAENIYCKSPFINVPEEHLAMLMWPCHHPDDTLAAEKLRYADASFIVGASLWDGANAKALKLALKYVCDEIQQGNPDGRKELESILANYPDELLRRYL